MVRITILEGGIDNILWLKIVLAITHIKNQQPTCAFKDNSNPIEIRYQALPDVQHLCILGSNVYIFLHKEKQALKSVKWEVCALKRKLVGFDGHTIYKIYIKDQNKVI